jgi:hypothetical protein
MVESGVATDVILTFIDNSTVAYYATAEDVVQLHELGVPSQTTAAVIRHGGKLRAQQAQAARESQAAVAAASATPNYSAAYNYAPPAQPTYVTYNYSYPAYACGYPSYGYVYPRYSYFTYPSFYFSYSSPFYFRHYYPYRFNHFYSRPIHSGIRVGFNSGHFSHGGIHVRGRL